MTILPQIIIDSLDTKTVIGILSLAGIVVTATWSYLGKRQSTAANKAVNHRPEGDPSIYELVRMIHEQTKDVKQDMRGLWERVDLLETFRDGFAGGALPNGVSVQKLVDKVDFCATQISELKKTLRKQNDE